MTRAQAIQEVIAAFSSVHWDRCASSIERRECDRDAVEALTALGVRPAELPGYLRPPAEPTDDPRGARE